MPRPLTAVAAAGVAAFACIALAATATGAPRAAAPCTLLAAKSGILVLHPADAAQARRRGPGGQRDRPADLPRSHPRRAEGHGRKRLLQAARDRSVGVLPCLVERMEAVLPADGPRRGAGRGRREGRGGDRSHLSGPATHGRAARAADRSTTASSGGAGRWPRFVLGIPAPPRHRIPQKHRALPAIVVVPVAGCGGSK